MILSQAWKQGDLMHLHSFWQYFYHNNIPIFNEFPDAAYIAAWMIAYCNLIGRKVVLETSETCFWGCFTLFPQWIRTMRKYCILNEVHLSSIRLQRYKIPWCFHRQCQLNAIDFHGYCLLTKREKISRSLFPFFPSVWLDFIARVYNNGH